MLTDPPRLQIYAPANGSVPGRGFYQLEEDSLHVPIGAYTERPFFSNNESDRIRLDMDRHGRRLFLEVDRPRRHWRIDPTLTKPLMAVPADIRWLDFRANIPEPEIVTDKLRSCLLIRFSNRIASRSFYLAEEVILQTDADDQLVSIFVGDIEDDLAGQEIRSFRLQSRLLASQRLHALAH
jgi:hypothetical protein